MTILKTTLTALPALVLLTHAALADNDHAIMAGGERFAAYIATAEAAKGTVVVLPTWNGLSDYEKDRAQMLADAGFNAMAIDLYPVGATPGTMEEKQAAHDALFADGDRLRAILTAIVTEAGSTLGQDLVVMGYSMGGGAAMELVRSGLGAELGVDGYAVFSGRVSDPEGRFVPDSTAPVFVAHGSEDARVPVSALINFEDDLDMAGVTYQIEVYEGRGHLFSAFGFPNYDAEADDDSWAKLVDFLTEATADAAGAS